MSSERNVCSKCGAEVKGRLKHYPEWLMYECGSGQHDDGRELDESKQCLRNQLTAALAAKERAERERDEYRVALEEIKDPIAFMRERADEAGCGIDGQMAVMCSKDPGYLQNIARAALQSESTQVEGNGEERMGE